MKHSLTVMVVLAGAAALIAVREGFSFNPEPMAAAPIATRSVREGAPAPIASNTTQDGNLLVHQAVLSLREMTSLEAKARLETHLFGKDLVGSGGYYQLVRAPETLVKFEIKMQVANQVSSLLQVSDGRFFWTRRDLPTFKFLGRVDQRRVTEALVAAGRAQPPESGANFVVMGGLSKTLENINGSFLFEEPRADTLGGSPVWVVRGTWRNEVLGAHLKREVTSAVPLEELPEQLPSHVELWLSRDPALHLFPHRIDFRRASGAGEGTSIATLDLFGVRRNIALDPRLFSYKPGDQEVVDYTEDCLRGMGL